MSLLLEEEILKINEAKRSDIYHIDISNVILRVAKTLPVLWPIKNFVACNPMIGFEKNDFNQSLLDSFSFDYSNNEVESHHELQKINTNLIKWLTVFFDEGQAKIQIPNKNDSLLNTILQLLPYDNNIDISMSANLLQEPNNIKIINLCLNKLTIKDDEIECFIEFNLKQLLGWSAYIRFICEYKKKSYELIFDYLALRLILTASIWSNAPKYLFLALKTKNKQLKPRNIIKNIEENEKNYQKHLIELLKSSKSGTNKTQKFNSQFLFCIDTRSEPIRYKIESLGNYQTFGTAGFFNLLLSIESEELNYRKSSLPAILEPNQTISLSSLMNKQDYQLKKIRTQANQLYKTLKYSFSTPLFLVELLGPAFGLLSIFKTFFKNTLESLKPKRQKCENNIIHNHNLNLDIPIQAQTNTAYQLLKSIGLISNFSDYVIVCGHKSYNKNNMYHNALNCGACQGENGLYNSQVIVNILNNQNVRKELTKRNIFIPNDTTFIASEHNTTNDDISLILTDSLKTSDKLKIIQDDLKLAQSANTSERLKKLNIIKQNKDSISVANNLSIDWSTIRPEWGLAKNAAFIIGPRNVSKNINLEGRSFLQSYDYTLDEDHTILDGIINGPLKVAYWINTQYLFSTIDNNKYGSGCKTTQNLTGKIGVMQGNLSDLKIGLPLQSVNTDLKNRYHQPIRLNVFVFAPLNYIKAVINNNEFIKNLIENKWIHMFCIDPMDRSIHKI